MAAWQVVNSDPTDVNLQEKTTHRSLSTLVRRKLAFWVIPKSLTVQIVWKFFHKKALANNLTSF